jgi:hypothetical protein
MAVQHVVEDKFELESARVTAEGLLLLAGTFYCAQAEEQAWTGAGFVLVERGSKAERKFAAETPGGQGGRVECHIPLAALDSVESELLDVYFVASVPSGEVRIRIGWQLPLRWLPYPTKFGNLSFKRMGA